jgi:galactonate dehydratase
VKITEIQTVFVDRFLFVQVRTDVGITGLGESGAWGYLESSEKAVEKFAGYLVGEDPLRIEHHWQYMYRWSHFRGAAIMGAISAIDIALWDIAGKQFGVPAYQLLGGACRDRARCYVHVFGSTTEELVDGCRRAKDDGFTAVGHLTPFLDERPDIPYFETHVGKMRAAIDRVRQYREAVGDSVDLCIEVHRRLSPAEAIVLGNGIEPYHPMFYEDPVRPDNFDSMAAVARQVSVPIATGERIHTLEEFAMLLTRGAVQYVRPDVCLAGGLTHTKKIAALAEAFGVGVVPHNPLSPVSTAACLQLAACIPNFSLQEYPHDEGSSEKREVVDAAPIREGDSLLIPDRPGIGIELAPDAAERRPYRARLLDTRLATDGSVVDQ